MNKKIRWIAVIALAAVFAGAGSATQKTKPGERASLAATTLSRVEDPVQIQAGPPTGWSAIENVSNTPNYSDLPLAVVDAKNFCYVTWTEWFGGVGARRDMMFNQNKSGKWGAAEGVSLSYTAIDDVGFPSLGVTPDGTSVLMAWHDADWSLGHMAILAAERLNSNWSPVSTISGSGEPACSYPTVAVNPKDNSALVIFMADVNGFVLGWTYRNGTTGRWTNADVVPVQVGAGQYLPYLHFDASGTAHLVYITRPGEALVWYTKNPTPSNPNTWTAPYPIAEGTGLDWSYPKVATDSKGNAHVVWPAVVAGDEEIMYRYQVNGAWQPTEIVSNTPYPSGKPSVAVNTLTDEVYIAWQEAYGSGNWEVMLKTYEIDKATGSKKWSSNLRVTDSPEFSGDPSLVSSIDGDIHLFFGDQGEIKHTVKLAPRLTGIAAPVVTSQINRVLFSKEKTLTINFTKNLENDDATLKEYRLYYKKAEEGNSAYTVLATFAPTDTLQYIMKKLAVSQKYTFIASVVNKDGLEIQTAAVISD
jgi:hypothetical protein